LALGWEAFGACAIGWNAAGGGVVLARDLALGVTQAAQANSNAVRTFMATNRFFQISGVLAKQVAWLNLFWVFPAMTLCRWLMRRADGNRTQI